ncbi:hypothetical protein [Streptomyces lancefieldiae]|uniref:Uncharacterized protein n=1 Tax=Streptomyces lancefieldiae TaxID=3075520 RepID=A0ABU3ARL1_9ACTN|nr:hypothetical protein [Streptomyces sp. DSM 40712]MDT0612835.1 hypothetical protein [Streptomyces sp. DSM 40712]
MAPMASTAPMASMAPVAATTTTASPVTAREQHQRHASTRRRHL